MKLIFYVDCPDPTASGNGALGWINVDAFDTREEAVAYVRSHWGETAAEHADLFIMEGEL